MQESICISTKLCMHKRQMLKNTTQSTQSTTPNSLKPSKTSPPLASIAKMGEKNCRVTIVRVPPQRVHFS